MNARLVSITSESFPSAKRDALLDTLRGLLRESFELRYRGASYALQARAQGYADGFMRSLLDSGLMTEREMLTFVRDVRWGVDGPSTTTLPSDDSIFAA